MTNANPSPMAQMIHDSGLAFAGGFPILVQCADIVLSCGAHFNPNSSELANMHGELIGKIDAVVIGTALRIPEMDNVIVISQNRAQALFYHDSEKYKARVAKSWLKNPKKGVSHLSKTLFHNIKITYHHRADTEDYWADCVDDFEARRRHSNRFSLQLIQELCLYQVPEGLQDDNSNLYSYEYENVFKHTPLEDLDWFKKEKDDFAEILAPVLVRTKIWFDRKVHELRRHSRESSSKDASTPRREASKPRSEAPVKTPPASSTQGHAVSTPSSSTQVYQKKVKEIKKDSVEKDPLRKHAELPSRPENIIVLSESEESEVPAPPSTLEVPMDKDNEVQSTEIPSTVDSSTPRALSAPLISQLEATTVQTLGAMSSLSLIPLAPPASSSSSFAWVQPLVDSRKRKSSSQISGPNFDVVASLLGTTPPTHAKKARITSRIVFDTQGQQFLEIANPKADKPEQDLQASDLELSRIPMGESTPE
ncbi:hypothetical protein KI387_031107, partial [Taxus chinensis]